MNGFYRGKMRIDQMRSIDFLTFFYFVILFAYESSRQKINFINILYALWVCSVMWQETM